MPSNPAPTPQPKPVLLPDFARMRAAGEKIACLTAYDASFAAVEDRAGVDLVLVGDSLGNVIQGRATTTAVSVADIVYHARCVAPSLKRAYLAADLPFLSYATPERALDASARLMQDGGAQMVKLEGGREQAAIVELLVRQGIPLCVHFGMQPQRVHKMGGFKVQGRGDAAAEVLLEDARILAEAGADLLLVECIPAKLARLITEQSPVPVIGIGAGVDCSGQILVLQDILDISPLMGGRRPRFVKDFLKASAEAGKPDIESAIRAYVEAVKRSEFPAAEHAFEG